MPSAPTDTDAEIDLKALYRALRLPRAIEEKMLRLIRQGVIDLIGAARQSLADPDWYLKARMGRGAEVRTCEYTNYCEGLDQKHKVVTCKLWDRAGLDVPGVKRTDDGKRRTIAPDWDGAPRL